MQTQKKKVKVSNMCTPNVMIAFVREKKIPISTL